MKQSTSKIETVAQPELTVGLDISDKKCQFCVVDAVGDIVSSGEIKLTFAPSFRR